MQQQRPSLGQLLSCQQRARCVTCKSLHNAADSSHVARRSLLAVATAGVLLGLVQQEHALAEPTSPVGPSDILITPAGKGFKSYMDARDEAMRNKCPGGMFDCEGDRREYAKQQYKDFLAAGGKGERLRNGGKGPRSR